MHAKQQSPQKMSQERITETDCHIVINERAAISLLKQNTHISCSLKCLGLKGAHAAIIAGAQHDGKG